MAGELQPFMFDTKPYQAQTFASAAATAPRLGTDGGHSGGKGGNLTQGLFDGADNFESKFFNNLMGPQLEAQRKLKFYQGAAQVMAGKTVDQIHKDQPWFANVFGTTPYEEGATVYTADKSAAEMANEVHQNMDKFKDKSPDEMGAYLNEQASKMMTGDVMADAVIQKSWLTASGPLMEAQTKANYAWKQDQLQQAQSTNVQSQGRLLQTQLSAAWKLGQDHPDQAVTPEQTNAMMLPFLDSLQMPDGQNTQSYLKTVEDSTYAMARENNWHAVAAMQKTGLFDKMPIDQQERMDKKMQTLYSQSRSRMQMDPANNDLAMWSAGAKSGVLSGAQVREQGTQINRRIAAATGFPADFITADQMDAMESGAATKTWEMSMRMDDKLAAAQEKAKTQEDKEHAEALENDNIVTHLKMGTTDSYLNIPGKSKDKVDFIGANMFDNMMKGGNAAGAMDVLANNVRSANGSYVNDVLSKRLITAAKAGGMEQYNDAVGNALTAFQGMMNYKDPSGKDTGVGVAMARSYFKDQYDKMYDMNKDIEAGLRPQEAYAVNFSRQADTDQQLRGSESYKVYQKNIDDAVDNISPGLFARVFGGQTGLSKSTKEYIKFKAGPEMARRLQAQPYLGGDAIANQAVQWVKDNGGEIAGRFAWQNGRSQKALSSELNIPTDVFGDVFDQSVTNKLRKSGFAPDGDTTYDVHRLNDDGDGARMVVIANGKDGSRTHVVLTGKDFSSASKAWNEKKVRDKRVIHTTDNTGTMDVIDTN